MNNDLKKIKTEVYNLCNIKLSDFETAAESNEYKACRFILNGIDILSRNAKVTPKRSGSLLPFGNDIKVDRLNLLTKLTVLIFMLST